MVELTNRGAHLDTGGRPPQDALETTDGTSVLEATIKVTRRLRFRAPLVICQPMGGNNNKWGVFRRLGKPAHSCDTGMPSGAVDDFVAYAWATEINHAVPPSSLSVPSSLKPKKSIKHQLKEKLAMAEPRAATMVLGMPIDC